MKAKPLSIFSKRISIKMKENLVPCTYFETYFNLTSYSSFLYKNFVNILLLYENPSIRQFVANHAFQKLQYQRQAGYL